MLEKATTLISNLVVYTENMKHNLEKTNGLVFSQALLLHLTNKGLSRESAYSLVQRNALLCWQTGESFLTILLRDHELTALLNPQELQGIFDYERYLQHIDFILKRCGI